MIAPPLPPPPPNPAPANALAVLQAADCVTTAAFMRLPGTFERNPISRALGANRSLPLCLVEAAAFNIGIRTFDRSRGLWFTKTIATIEAAVVGNNVRLLIHLQH